MSKRFAPALLIAAAAVAASSGPSADGAFSGENGKLAFVRAGTIWVAEADGSNAVSLTSGIDRSPRWSPDGSRIAFSSGRDGDFEIFVMNADGSGQRQITFNAGQQDRIPSWTADGTQIVYDKDFSAVYVVDAEGGAERKLADGFVPGTSSHGDEVVFGRQGLVTMHLVGSARRQVTSNGSDFGANWSPTGNELVFTRSNTDRDVYRVRANGGGLVRVTNTPDRFEFAPVWSPDGEKIAFVGCAPGGAQPCDLVLANADGSGEAVVVPGVSGGEGAVDWQPLPSGPRQDSVVGSGNSVFTDFPELGQSTREQYIVSAHSGPLGEDPHGQLTLHSPLLVGQAKAEVTCLVVTGNRARVGGVFEEPVVYLGATFRWIELIVEDNDPPVDDRMTSFIFFDRPRPPGFSPCNFDGSADFTFDRGNITVRDAAP